MTLLLADLMVRFFHEYPGHVDGGTVKQAGVRVPRLKYGWAWVITEDTVTLRHAESNNNLGGLVVSAKWWNRRRMFTHAAWELLNQASILQHDAAGASKFIGR